jgi:5-methylcytosine-specific restriction endonuclease McrA
MNVLSKHVLILNKSWDAIRISTVKLAIKVVFAERAMFVDEDYTVYDWDEWLLFEIGDNEECIHSAKTKIRIPEVVVLKNYNKIPKRKLRLTKRNLMFRDKYCCQYTGELLKPSELDIDHVQPLSRGGTNSWDNMVVTSIKLNRKKDNKTPEEAGLSLIKEPVEPKPISFFLDPRIEIPKSWPKFIDITKL